MNLDTFLYQNEHLFINDIFFFIIPGMMPLYVWLGNPFCFPCIPLRILVVFPGGLITMVMTFGPVMGVTKNRLLQFAPPG